MPFLRQNTVQTIRFGPFLDATDGVTEEVALTITQALRRISKDGGAFAQSSETGNSTHDSDGWYSDDLTATDTDTVGELILNVQAPATHLPVWMRWWVLEEEVYDDIYGASAVGYLKPVTGGNDVDVTATGAVGIDWGNVENAGTTVDLSATDINLADTVTTLTGHTVQTGDSFARLGAPAGASVSADIADLPTVAEFDARTLVAASYFDPAADTVANVTTVATLTGHTAQTGDSFARLGAPAGASVSADILDLPTVAEFNARTLDAASYFDPAADTVATVTTVTTLTGHTAQTGDSFARLGAPAGASVSADIAAIKAETADILHPLASGTAQTGTASTIQLAAAETFADDELNGNVVKITGGTGVGQSRVISDYTSSTDTATVSPDWITAPDVTSTYEVVNGSANVTTWLVTSVDPLVAGRVPARVFTFATGAITSAAYTAGAIDAAAIATDAIDADALAADAVTEIRDAILPVQNTALSNIEFLFVAASDHVTPVTGASGTGVTRSIDGGAFGAGTGTLAEVGNGIYQYDASAADMNGGIITFRFTGTGGTPGAPDDAFLTIVTGAGV
jgi:hypothetical protein